MRSFLDSYRTCTLRAHLATNTQVCCSESAAPSSRTAAATGTLKHRENYLFTAINPIPLSALFVM